MVNAWQLILFWIIIDVPYLVYRGFLLFRHMKRKEVISKPLVSILIPAYNEEPCIEKTLYSCLNQTYPRIEIIVINDGSTDKTLDVVKNFQTKYHNNLEKRGIKLRIISQKNQGKARALNVGKAHANGVFIATIDADSYLHHDAIYNILHYFSSKKIGAVAGNIVALSHGKILGYVQKIEYELGIYFLRESQAALGDVLVTPGAFSAYRKKAIKKFEEGTLTEDFDSSIRTLERGYSIVMAPDAYCFTQVPLSVADLIKQRIRWQQGGLEVFAKHVFHKKRFFVRLEWFFLFFFGFYGLFSRILGLVFLPIVFFSGGISAAASFIGIFLLYTLFIHTIQFIIVNLKSKDKKAVLAAPLFILYYYTIVMYAVLIAQILVFKRRQKWEKIKRYHM